MTPLLESMKNPSGVDSMANYAGDLPDACWLTVLTRSRDSDILTESNWEVALKRLGGESESVEIFRFGHWACGWWEALCVKAGTDGAIIGAEIESELKAYPILDEDHFSEMEQVEADRIWAENYSYSERIEYIREHDSQFEFNSFSDLISCVRGEYFRGYASELVG